MPIRKVYFALLTLVAGAGEGWADGRILSIALRKLSPAQERPMMMKNIEILKNILSIALRKLSPSRPGNTNDEKADGGFKK